MNRSFLRLLLLTCALGLTACGDAAGQALDGRWSYSENGQTAELDVRHDRASGQITGTISLFGASLPIEGKATGTELVIESMGGAAVSLMGSVTGRLEDGVLHLTVAQNGEAPVTMPMARVGGAPSPAPAAAGEAPSTGRSAAAAPDDERFSPASAQDFAGEWEQVSDDGTEGERLELDARGGAVSGTLVAVERGYYSGQVTVKAQVALEGAVRDGTWRFRIRDPQTGEDAGVEGTGHRRGEFLVVRIGGNETGYARPGRPLVESAEGSAQAEALARAVTGRVYEARSGGHGRDGAYAGGRVRLALCSDGRISFDASDLATVPGAGGATMGDSYSRRGSWSVVLVAGAPAVRAHWDGTGSSYALTRYFRIRPSADGRSAVVDGTELPAAGRC